MLFLQQEDGSKGLGKIAKLARTVKKGRSGGLSAGGMQNNTNNNSVGGGGSTTGGSTLGMGTQNSVERYSPKSTKSSLVNKTLFLF